MRWPPDADVGTGEIKHCKAEVADTLVADHQATEAAQPVPWFLRHCLTEAFAKPSKKGVSLLEFSITHTKWRRGARECEVSAALLACEVAAVLAECEVA